MITRSTLLISALAASATWLGAASLPATAQVVSGTVGIQPGPSATIIEEGSNFDGTVVRAPDSGLDYVLIDGRWYYYHPTLHAWVHVDHDKDWRPPHDGHIYRSWSDHPMYRDHRDDRGDYRDGHADDHRDDHRR